MTYIPRLKLDYHKRIIASLKESFSYKSVMQVPRLLKIVLSRGIGSAVADKKLIEHAIDELTLITGQKAVATVSLDVFSATTTSKSFIMLAGEKKCKPITLPGLSTTEAISFTFK